jgi:hypothetical protein
MKRANKIRKIVTRIAAGVMLAFLLAFNLQIGVGSNGSSHLSLSKLAFGMFTPAVSGTGGGCGSQSNYNVVIKGSSDGHYVYKCTSGGSTKCPCAK